MIVEIIAYNTNRYTVKIKINIWLNKLILYPI